MVDADLGLQHGVSYLVLGFEIAAYFLYYFANLTEQQILFKIHMGFQVNMAIRQLPAMEMMDVFNCRVTANTLLYFRK
jgi:hypothetical protein